MELTTFFHLFYLVPSLAGGEAEISKAKAFSSFCSDHQDVLRQLWRLAYPDRLPALKSEVWKEMGLQGSDPSTDFRISVRCGWHQYFLYAGSNVTSPIRYFNERNFVAQNGVLLLERELIEVIDEVIAWRSYFILF